MLGKGLMAAAAAAAMKSPQQHHGHGRGGGGMINLGGGGGMINLGGGGMMPAGITIVTGDVGDPWECLMKATTQNAIQCSMAFSKLQQQATNPANPNWYNENAQKYADVLTTWAKRFNFEGGDRDPMMGPLSSVSSLYNGTVIPKVSDDNWRIILPPILALLAKRTTPRTCKMSLSSVFTMMRMQKPAVMFPISEMILSAVFANNISELASLIVALYPKQKKLVQQHVLKVIEWQEAGQYCIDGLDLVSLDAPEALLPHIERLLPFTLQTQNAISFQAGSIILNLAQKDPYKLSNYVSQIVDAYDCVMNPQLYGCKVTLCKVFGLIGRTSKPKAEECMNILHNYLQSERTNDVTAAILVEMKNIGGVFKSVLEGKREDVKAVLTSQFEGVRSQAANILDYLDNKEINSLPTALAIQDAKIEQAHIALGNMAIKHEENSREIVKLNDTSANQQAQLDSHQAQITDLDRRVSEIKSANEYIDSKLSEMKVFIAEITKKLPVPSKFSADGILVKTISLDFHCSLHRDGDCLHPPDGAAFVTKTREWSKWVKLSISAAKMGLAIYNKDAIGAIESAYDIYEQLKDFDDPTFDKFVSEPFLTSAEQDNMINQLRDAKYFDVFKYDPQTATWMCCNCAKPPVVESPGVKAENEAIRAAGGTPPPSKNKKHKFVRYHFHRFTWCVYCDQFIWGLGKQGYKCTTCKYRCHPQCLQHVPDNCGQIDIKCHLSGKNAKDKSPLGL